MVEGLINPVSVTLQCTRDGQFVLVVARDATMPRINLDSIHLLEDDPSGQCASVGTSASFAIYQFPVRSCGTKMMVRHNRKRSLCGSDHQTSQRVLMRDEIQFLIYHKPQLPLAYLCFYFRKKIIILFTKT